jgi:hypothetical protein
MSLRAAGTVDEGPPKTGVTIRPARQDAIDKFKIYPLATLYGLTILRPLTLLTVLSLKDALHLGSGRNRIWRSSSWRWLRSVSALWTDPATYLFLRAVRPLERT